MRTFFSRAIVVVVVAGFSVTLVGCGQVQMLKARMAVKDGHGLYQAQDWKAAAEAYERTIAECEDFQLTACANDPNLTPVFFFLGNSYDNMYIPSRRDDAANEEVLNKAIRNYQRAADIELNPQQIKTLAMQYLVAAYGSDKLNDPEQAEPLLQKMIAMEPKEVANYTLLSQLYENSGDYENAEATLIKARDAKPEDPIVYSTLAGYYDRQGQFDKLIEALEARVKQEPSNPEAYYTMATYYFNKGSRDFSISPADKMKYTQAGVVAVDKALAINGEYMEALVFKGLLLRLQANLEKNVARQQALLKEAQAISDRAEEIRKKRAAGLG